MKAAQQKADDEAKAIKMKADEEARNAIA